MPAGPSAGMPETLTRGLQLMDSKALEAAMRAVERKEELRSGSAPIYFAEDICIGYRPDVLRVKDNRPDLDWAPLTARQVRIDEVWKAMGEPANNDKWHPYHDYDGMRDRDHSFVRPMAKIIPKADGSGVNGAKDVAPSEILFTWKGDSLGVPSATSDTNDAPHDGTEDLPFAISFEYSPLPEDHAPVLRVGDSYAFGLRGVMPNGASIPLGMAKAFYGSQRDRTLSTKYALGAGGNPVPFRHAENTHAPTILLPGEDPVAQAKAGPGESDTHIVLRSRSRTNQSHVQRYLVPARRHFEFSEQHGLFDTQLNRQTPFGAFLGFKRDDFGNFPAVRGGHPAKDDPAKNDKAVDGMILTACPPVSTEAFPYYPDPTSRNVIFGIERNGVYPPNFPQESKKQSFWRNNQNALNARPILIDVRAVAGSASAVRAPDIDTIPNGVDPRVDIDLAEGEQATLWFWAAPDPEDFHKTHIGAAFTDCMDRNLDTRLVAMTLEDRRNALHKRMASTVQLTPFNGYNGSWNTITLTHAVEKPLLAPTFLAAPGVVRRPLDGARNLMNQNRPDGATAAYFSGSLQFNRLTTAELRLEIAWMDWRTGKVVRNGTTGQFAFEPSYQQRTLLPRLGTIPVDCDAPDGTYANSANVFDLEFREDHTLRGIHHDFQDTAARRLAFRASATSRFVEFFERRPQDPLQFEIAGRDPFDPAKPLDFKTETASWVLSTRRPPAPVIDRIEWITSEIEQPPTAPGTRTITKRCMPRVYLAGDWFVQGEDELLAIVFAKGTIACNIGFDGQNGFEYDDPQLADPNMDGSALKATLAKSMAPFDEPDGGPLHQFVTRWGADPIVSGGVLSAFMPAEQFSGFAGRVVSVAMPLSQPSDPTTPSDDAASTVGNDSSVKPVELTVDALLYRTEVDPRTGERYVDLPIDAETIDSTTFGAHNPFVQIAFARFQPHSEGGLWMSEPTLHDAIQIPASRTVTISTDGHSKVNVKVEGRGYSARAPYFNETHVRVDDEDKLRLSLPLMNVQLLRESDRTGQFIAAFDAHGDRVKRQSVGGGAGSTMLYMPPNLPIDGTSLTWYSEIDLPLPLSAQRYALQIDEIELHVPDADPDFLTKARPEWSITAEAPDPDGNLPDPSNQHVLKLSVKPAMFSCRAIIG